MRAHYENKVMSSFLQFVDHTVCEKGQAFTNHSSSFYPGANLYNGYYTYAAPFKQFVADVSISGASVMKEVYVDGASTSVGETGSNLEGINHYDGQLYFSADKSSNAISGNYAVKDFNIYLTNEPEERVLFEEKYYINPKTNQTPTGLDASTQTYPAIYIKNVGGQNVPFALGGTDNTQIQIRSIILADSSFALDAVCGILKDTFLMKVPIIESLPFDALNAYNGTDYDYTGLATGHGPRIWDVHVSKNVARGSDLNPGVFTAFVDFELHDYRNPRT